MNQLDHTNSIPVFQGPGAKLLKKEVRQEPSLKLQRLTASRVQPLVRLKLKKLKKPQQLSEEIIIPIGAENAFSPRTVLPTPRWALAYMRDHMPSNPTNEQREQIIKETVDPFLTNRPEKNIPRKVWAALPIVFLCTLIMQLACLGIDRATQSWTLYGVIPSYYDYSLWSAIWTMLNPTYDQSQAVLNAINVYLVFIISLLISTIGLVLNFASDKITENVTTLVFRDKIVLLGFGSVIWATIYSLWEYDSVGPFQSARTGVYISTLNTVLLLVLLFPYVMYLFSFLDIEIAVTKIMENGLNSVISCINSNGQDPLETERNKITAAIAIEDMMDAAISGIKKRSTNVTSEIIDALCSFAMHFVAVKDKINPVWFEIPTWMRQSPDFVFLSNEAIDDMVKRRLWVEWKILRQLQTLFVEAIRDLKEMCYHICINTRIIAESGIDHNTVELVDCSIKFFNTYLRNSINMKDFRVIYNSLFQYRKLAESLLNRDRARSKAMIERGLKVAKFMRYYAWICQQSRLFFLVETAAHDLQVLCQKALQSAVPPRGTSVSGPGVSKQLALFREAHERCLEIFLSLDDFTFGDARRGVRRQQIMLAAFYISEGQNAQAMKIKHQLDRAEDRNLMVSLREELSAPTTKEFWEVSERGSNFSHVELKLRQKLPVFFGWFAWMEDCSKPEFMTAYWNSVEGKKIQVQRELTNFNEDDDDDEATDTQKQGKQKTEDDETDSDNEKSPNAPTIVHLCD